MNPENTSDAIRATQAREACASTNRDSLIRLMAQHGLNLPYATLESWRPTKPSSGNLPGFERQFTLLCTDGCVAWFEDVFGVLFYGHIQHFTGKVEPLHSLSKPGSTASAKREGSTGTKAKSPKAPKVTVANALEVLRQTLEKM